MKKQFVTSGLFYAFSFATFLFTACEKSDSSLETDTTTGGISDASSVTATIAVVASPSVANADSVYVVQPCPRGAIRDSIAEADLPASVSTYLDAAYSGYLFHKAFAIKDSAGTVSGYAVIVYYNDKPVGLKFDAAGAFVKVLEQRERGDLKGDGHHRGGRFQHRDGKGRDSIDLSALPASITAYFATNYSSDTLLKAYKTIDSSVVVLSKNNGLFATVFDAGGTFVKRTSLPAKDTRNGAQISEESALPAAMTTYLTATYPNYVFQKAFTVKDGSIVAGYIVVIDANNTKYAVAFDASGTFVSAKTLY